MTDGRRQRSDHIVNLVPTLLRGNAVFDALRRRDVVGACRYVRGRGASRTAFPRGAWERGSIICMILGLFLAARIASADGLPKRPAEVRGPLSPQRALAGFRVDPGLRVELVAAEPEVESPVAMAFDE